MAVLALAAVAASNTLDATPILIASTFTTGQFYSIDPVSGAQTLIGTLADRSSGLSSANNNLYQWVQGLNNQIRQIDPATLAVVNAIAFPFLVGGEGGFAVQSGAQFAYLALGNNFYRLDLATGTATTLTTTLSQVLDGLEFGSDGNLYALGQNFNTTQRIYRVDTATGALTQVLDTGIVNNAGGAVVSGLAAHPDGRLFATLNERIYAINLGTSSVTLVSDMSGIDISGLAIIDTAAVPEPSTWTMLAVAGAVLARKAAQAKAPAPPPIRMNADQ